MNIEKISQLNEMIDSGHMDVCLTKNRIYYFNGDGADRKLYMIRVEDMGKDIELRFVARLVSDRFRDFAIDCNNRQDKYIYLRYKFTNFFYCKYDIYNDEEQICKGKLLGFASEDGDKPVVKLDKLGERQVCILEKDGFVKIMEYDRYLTYKVRPEYLLLSPSVNGCNYGPPYRCYFDGTITEASSEEKAENPYVELSELPFRFRKRKYVALGSFEVKGDNLDYELVSWADCELFGTMIIPEVRNYDSIITYDAIAREFVISYKGELSRRMRDVIRNLFNLPRRKVKFIKNMVVDSCYTYEKV